MSSKFFNDIENPLLRAYNRIMFIKSLKELDRNIDYYLEELSPNARVEMQMVMEFIYSHGWEYTRRVVQNEILENSKLIDEVQV